MNKYEAIVIGVSFGGMHALSTIIPALPKNFSIPIVIVQHQMSGKVELLHTILDKTSQMSVLEAKQNEKICAKTVYIAPGGYHLLIEKNKTFALSVDLPVNHSIPSIDVLFESAAETYKSKLIGIILTGANNDGSLGLKKIREYGGLAIVEDPHTAQVNIMPQSALDIAGADFILSLGEIKKYLVENDYEK
ncbi:MAG: chemotaxis protein CheB [Campylobacteraceae bacterium]|nr:chemotaxis protein CheB [Campylobacteraceae bacterium]